MIACISPCAVDLHETISTLQYAAKTRSIQNKLSANVVTAPISIPNPIVLDSNNDEIIIKLTDQVTLLQVSGG
jgi:hypothetical protein